MEFKFSRAVLDRFLIEFETELQNLQNDLQQSKKINSSDENQSKNSLNNHLERLNHLRSKLAQNNELLPPYEMKRLQSKLDQSGETLNQVQQDLKPRSKFTFKKLPVLKPKPALPANGNDEEVVPKNASKLKMPSSECTGNIVTVIVNKTNEIIEQTLITGNEVELTDLTDCSITLIGMASTLRILRCVTCDVKVGPVSRSIFVNDCSQCKLHLTCQQLRIHTTKDCDFHVRVTSGAIIEHCNDLRFLQLKWTYSDYERHLMEAGLRKDVNLWNRVQDFDWLAAEKPSPNWRPIE